jgi:hypothetical protein
VSHPAPELWARSFPRNRGFHSAACWTRFPYCFASCLSLSTSFLGQIG